MATTTLREFVVRLGFKVESTQERNFDESMRKTAKGAGDIVRAFAKIAGATVAGMSASSFALKKVADGLTGLYFAAQRTGSSVKELKVLQYGFEQVGLSAEEATSSVEALAAARRQNPGLNGLLAGWGINTADNSKAFVQLLGKLREFAPAIRAQYASMFGLDEGVVNQLENNGPALFSAFRRREQMFEKEGYNPDAASRKALDFFRAWNDAKARYSDMAQEMAVKLLPLAERFIGVLEKTADWLIKADRATGGWVLRIGALATALLPILAALKISGAGGLLAKGLGGLLGGAGEAAAGGIGLGAIALPAVVIAALGALIWLIAHPDQLKEQVDQAHQIGDKMRAGLDSAWEWTKGVFKGQVDQAHGIGDKLSSFGAGLMGDLARMVGKFEGFRNKVYSDIAGNATFGFGHKVRPGEDVSHADPISLFAGDLSASLAAVAKYVRVKLTDNQRKALASLEYNIGEGAFSRSTLLRKLNAGDYEAAADQFGVWRNANHHVSPALVARRATEAQTFRTPDSKSLNLQTSITIEGGDSARDTARETAREQKRVYSDIIRNFQPSYQ